MNADEEDRNKDNPSLVNLQVGKGARASELDL